jgi:hypothetical protein
MALSSSIKLAGEVDRLSAALLRDRRAIETTAKSLDSIAQTVLSSAQQSAAIDASLGASVARIAPFDRSARALAELTAAFERIDPLGGFAHWDSVTAASQAFRNTIAHYSLDHVEQFGAFARDLHWLAQKPAEPENWGFELFSRDASHDVGRGSTHAVIESLHQIAALAAESSSGSRSSGRLTGRGLRKVWARVFASLARSRGAVIPGVRRKANGPEFARDLARAIVAAMRALRISRAAQREVRAEERSTRDRVRQHVILVGNPPPQMASVFNGPSRGNTGNNPSEEYCSEEIQRPAHRRGLELRRAS